MNKTFKEIRVCMFNYSNIYKNVPDYLIEKEKNKNYYQFEFVYKKEKRAYKDLFGYSGVHKTVTFNNEEAVFYPVTPRQFVTALAQTQIDNKYIMVYQRGAHETMDPISHVTPYFEYKKIPVNMLIDIACCQYALEGNIKFRKACERLIAKNFIVSNANQNCEK